jgi:hypothetical protein
MLFSITFLVIPNLASRSSQLFYGNEAGRIGVIRLFSFVISYLALGKQPDLARLAAALEIR